MSFMMLGDIAHVTALEMEGKPIPAHLRHVKARFRRKFMQRGSNTVNVGFIMPGNGFEGLDVLFDGLSDVIVTIPFEEIGRVIGYSLTAYSYYKIVIIGYRYSQKLISKYKEYRRRNKLKNLNSSLVRKQAKILIVSILMCPSFGKAASIQRIYRFAVS